MESPYCRSGGEESVEQRGGRYLWSTVSNELMVGEKTGKVGIWP